MILDRETKIKKLEQEIFYIDKAISEHRVEIAKESFGHPYYEKKILELNGIAHKKECEILELKL
jgi:hypothetical protein